MTEKERTEKRKVIIENLENGSTRTAAAKQARIDRKTFYHWAAASKKFARRINEALLSQVSVIEDALYKTAVEGNVAAQKFFLCNRASKRWKERIEERIEHSGKLEPLKVIIEKGKDG